MPTLRLLPDLEDSLRQLPGVHAASVVTGPDAVPTEVHVLARPGKAAKQVVRDVQSLAMARYDIDIDHRIVSVVQIGDQEVAVAGHVVDSNGSSSNGSNSNGSNSNGSNGSHADGALPAQHSDSAHELASRPAIAAIMVRTGRDVTDASVTLTARDALFEGKAEGPAGSGHRARIVAMATLDALKDLLGRGCEVESASVVSNGTREVAFSVLTMMVPRIGEQVLTGCAVVRGDDADAVARSVLSALNRQLTG